MEDLELKLSVDTTEAIKKITEVLELLKEYKKYCNCYNCPFCGKPYGYTFIPAPAVNPPWIPWTVTNGTVTITSPIYNTDAGGVSYG